MTDVLARVPAAQQPEPPVAEDDPWLAVAKLLEKIFELNDALTGRVDKIEQQNAVLAEAVVRTEAIAARFEFLEHQNAVLAEAASELLQNVKQELAALRARVELIERKPAARTVEFERDDDGRILRSVVIEG
jgi:hypothetical protein